MTSSTFTFIFLSLSLLFFHLSYSIIKIQDESYDDDNDGIADTSSKPTTTEKRIGKKSSSKDPTAQYDECNEVLKILNLKVHMFPD